MADFSGAIQNRFVLVDLVGGYCLGKKQFTLLITSLTLYLREMNSYKSVRYTDKKKDWRI